jgi:hypothetical protein
MFRWEYAEEKGKLLGEFGMGADERSVTDTEKMNAIRNLAHSMRTWNKNEAC